MTTPMIPGTRRARTGNRSTSAIEEADRSESTISDADGLSCLRARNRRRAALSGLDGGEDNRDVNGKTDAGTISAGLGAPGPMTCGHQKPALR